MEVTQQNTTQPEATQLPKPYFAFSSVSFLSGASIFLFVGVGVYLYKANNEHIILPKEEPVHVIQESQPAAILCRTETETMNEKEKGLIETLRSSAGYISRYASVPVYASTPVPQLCFYDSHTALFGISSGKGGGPLYEIYNIETFQKLDENSSIGLYTMLETKRYVFGMGYSPKEDQVNILYYEAGASQFKTIASSTLASDETYISGESGLDKRYDFEFNETTRTGVAKVYKNDGNVEHTYVRTFTFTLP